MAFIDSIKEKAICFFMISSKLILNFFEVNVICEV